MLRTFYFARKYGTERTKDILMLSDRKTLYSRYGHTVENKRTWAVITGGTNGLGYKIAKLLAKQGFNICILGRNQEKIDVCIQKIKFKTNDNRLKIKSLLVDFSEMATIEDYKIKVGKKLIDFDIGIVVLSAGCLNEGPFADITAK